MIDFLRSNSYFFILLTVAAFCAGRGLQLKWKSPLLNPILIGTILVCIVLAAFQVPYAEYQAGVAPMQYLLTPATICFGISMYEQLSALRKHLAAILIGVIAGTVASLGSIYGLCMAFGLDRVLTVSLLPKSITTAIGMVLSEEAGGIGALTTAAIILTGIIGNIFGPVFCKWLHLKDPIAQGVAIGTASHAIGTSKAIEMSHLTGAVSSLSLTLAGLVTVVLFSFLTI